MENKTKEKKKFYKRWWFWLIVLIVGISVSSNGNKKTTTKNNNIDLKLDVEVNNNNGKPIITVKSNLPVKTQGMITLQNKKANYLGSSTVTPNDGKFTTETFTNNGQVLPNGEYSVQFSTPLSSIQPKEVQDIIGKDYCNVISKFVKKDELGTTICMEKIVKISSSSSISDKKIDKNDTNIKVQAKSLLEELNSKYNSKPSDAEWAKFTREFMPKVNDLENKTTDKLIKIAIGDVKQLLAEYRKDLQGRGDSKTIQYFRNEIQKNLN